MDTSTAFSLRRAATPGDWRVIAGLRYRSLRARGDIAPSSPESFIDCHDRSLHCQAYLLASPGGWAGTTRSSVSSAARRRELPCTAVFGPAIAASLGDDATLLEASLTAVAPGMAEPREAILHLFKAHMLRAAAEGADWILAAVADRQIGFYQRVLNMRMVSGAELCSGFAAPRVLMALDFRANAELLRRRLPMLR